MLGMFGQSVRNFCPTFVRGELKSVRKINIRNFIHTMYSVYIFIYLIIFFFLFIYPNFKYVTVIHHVCICKLIVFYPSGENHAKRKLVGRHIVFILILYWQSVYHRFAFSLGPLSFLLMWYV